MVSSRLTISVRTSLKRAMVWRVIMTGSRLLPQFLSAASLRKTPISTPPCSNHAQIPVLVAPIILTFICDSYLRARHWREWCAHVSGTFFPGGAGRINATDGKLFAVFTPPLEANVNANSRRNAHLRSLRNAKCNLGTDKHENKFGVEHCYL
jgi:hypothetical protein